MSTVYSADKTHNFKDVFSITVFLIGCFKNKIKLRQTVRVSWPKILGPIDYNKFSKNQILSLSNAEIRNRGLLPFFLCTNTLRRLHQG